MNASWSFFGGAVLAWGIIAPSLIATRKAVGLAASDDYPLISYMSMSFDDVEQLINSPSPRYWLLWPGVLIMLLYSAVDVGFGAAGPLYRTFKSIRWVGGRNPANWLFSQTDVAYDDPSPKEDQVPTVCTSIITSRELVDRIIDVASCILDVSGRGLAVF